MNTSKVAIGTTPVQQADRWCTVDIGLPEIAAAVAAADRDIHTSRRLRTPLRGNI